MKQSERNLMVLQNFILHITHCSDEKEESFREKMEFTPEELYQLADSYLEEDHVDGEGNPDDEDTVCKDCVNDFDDPQMCMLCKNGSHKTLAQ